jgi:hypothetical protein
MRYSNRIYNGYSASELKELWENCTFIFDNNVLLDLYRTSAETRNLLLKTFDKFRDRIWLPQQVIHEFYKHRTLEIFETNSRYDDLESSVSKLKQDLIRNLRLKNDENTFDVAFNDLIMKIQEVKTRDLLVSSPQSDSILEDLLVYFDGKIGDSYSIPELDRIYKEGDIRFGANIPPGFEDIKKPIPERYGDLIIWNQILDYAETNNRSIVFVTNDVKKDWWCIVKGKTQGPLYELREEFINRTHKNFHMYTLINFLEYFQISEGNNVSDTIRDDIENLKILDYNIEGIFTTKNNNLINHFTSSNINQNPSNFLELLKQLNILLESGSFIGLVELSKEFRNLSPDLQTLQSYHPVLINYIKFLIELCLENVSSTLSSFKLQELNSLNPLFYRIYSELHELYLLLTSIKDEIVNLKY